MVKLSMQFNYSQSYCYKLVNKANDIIRTIGVDCQIRKKMNYLVVEGKESQIRVLSYILNTHSSTFAEDNYYSYHNEKNVTRIKQEKLSRITRVFMDAHKIGSYTDIDSKEETAISDCLYEEIRLGFCQTFYPLDKKINHSIYQSEKFFYYLFLSRIFDI